MLPKLDIARILVLLPGLAVALQGLGVESSARSSNSSPERTNLVHDVPENSWWTTEHVVAVLGGLACVFAITVLWNMLLRRKLKESTAEILRQARKHQTVKQEKVRDKE